VNAGLRDGCPRTPPAGPPAGCRVTRRTGQRPGARLSRRFYSPSLLPESPPADQHERASRRNWGSPPSAMRPRVPGPEGAESTDGYGRRGRERCADRPEERSADRSARSLAADLAFQDFLLPSSSLPCRSRARAQPRPASVMRSLAASISSTAASVSKVTCRPTGPAPRTRRAGSTGRALPETRLPDRRTGLHASGRTTECTEPDRRPPGSADTGTAHLLGARLRVSVPPQCVLCCAAGVCELSQ
jgi:hypothetical protein